MRGDRLWLIDGWPMCFDIYFYLKKTLGPENKNITM